jgi:outer membrane protein insertion porin family
VKRLLFSFSFLASVYTLHAAQPAQDPYEGLPVEKVTITVELQKPGDVDETAGILHKMETKQGDPFDQELFDHDLKLLNESYDWVEPDVEVKNKRVFIHLVVQKKPTVGRFIVEGRNLTKKLQKRVLKEGELKVGMEYDRDTFYKSLNKIRDYLIKKGFFQADVSYKIEKDSPENRVIVHVVVDRGPYGRLRNIKFEGFTPEEKKDIPSVIRPRKYNLLMSWFTGAGTIKQEEFDSDVQAIVHYMQNKGYVDAHVTMKIDYVPNDGCILVIHVERGPKYNFHNVSFSGNALHTQEELEKVSTVKTGNLFSIDQIRSTQEKIREIYTQEGYLQTNVDYTLNPRPDQQGYDVHFTVEESEQYRVGLVLVSGNINTNKKVVYNNINLEPGEVFDSRNIKATQQRLQSTGFFKNVNVYPIKPEEGARGNSEYCDVMVEVDEAQTGNASLFVGFSSTDSIYGGLDLTENNFDLAGFRNVWTDGPSAFRGGGQFFKMKGTVGQKESGASVSWLHPYFNDTLWRFGVDLDYITSTLLTKNYRIHTIGTQLSAMYPVTRTFTHGYKFRVKDSIIRPTTEKLPVLELQEAKNSGVCSAFGLTFGYDSTDNPFKPKRGLRSSFETEFAGLVRTHDNVSGTFADFPFLKFGYINSLYCPLWKSATLKFRLDLKFMQLLWGGQVSDLPLSEKFFLGGESTVRGYQNGQVGPRFSNGDPQGGISSYLGSVELAQNIIKPLDVFTFFDSGMVSTRPWEVSHIKMSVGAGVRIDIGKRMPFVVGYGYPLNPTDRNSDKEVQGLFFSMAGQF